jgi:tetratricopeptide (TPR) repeat protein
MELKEKGNAFLREGKYHDALDAYTEAILLNPTDHTFYSNRSAAYFNIGDYESALSDACKCIEIMPSWAKGHVRKGICLQYLRRFDEAIDAYKRGQLWCPTEMSLSQGLCDVVKVGEK